MTNMAISEHDLNNTHAYPIHLDQVLPTDGVVLRKPDIPAPLIWLARTILRLSGWRLYGQLPDVDKAVFPSAFHTSNWDGPLMLLITFAYGLRPVWMLKAEMTRGVLGPLLRFLGAMPIDRRSSHNAVQQAIDCIQQAERIALVIAPEGTRRKTDHWKTGFYWIAHGAGVPLIFGFLDYKHKRLGVGPAFMPSGNIDADMEQVWDFYRHITALNPAKTSEMRLRPYNHQKEA